MALPTRGICVRTEAKVRAHAARISETASDDFAGEESVSSVIQAPPASVGSQSIIVLPGSRFPKPCAEVFPPWDGRNCHTSSCVYVESGGRTCSASAASCTRCISRICVLSKSYDTRSATGNRFRVCRSARISPDAVTNWSVTARSRFR